MSLLDFAPAPLTASSTQETAHYNIVAVAGHYVNLTASDHDAAWTHWGYSPFLGGDEHSFAVNADTGAYECFRSDATGGVLDLVMFMEECSQEEALDWLAAKSPSEDGTPAEVVEENGPLPASAPDGPACAYPHNLPDFNKLAAELDQAASPEPVAPTAPVAVDGTVYHTTDYDLFHLLPQNRPIVPRQVRKLVEQIGRKNLLSVDPILVTSDMGIIDGQHRLSAARELGVPIFYKVAAQLSKEDIALLNTTKSNWLGTDYLHYWAVEGKPAYVAMTAFRKRHPIISFSNTLMMLSNSTSTRLAGFRDGLWDDYRVERAEEVAKFIEVIARDTSFKRAFDTHFVAAVFDCASTLEGFSLQTFLRKIMRNPRALEPCASRKKYLEMFDEIYNFSVSKDNRLNFSK